jgi:hypothetical protein
MRTFRKVRPVTGLNGFGTRQAYCRSIRAVSRCAKWEAGTGGAPDARVPVSAE